MTPNIKRIERFAVIMALLVASGALMAASARKQAISVASLKLAIEKLRPLHQKISKPGPND